MSSRSQDSRRHRGKTGLSLTVAGRVIQMKQVHPVVVHHDADRVDPDLATLPPERNPQRLKTAGYL